MTHKLVKVGMELGLDGRGEIARQFPNIKRKWLNMCAEVRLVMASKITTTVIHSFADK